MGRIRDALGLQASQQQLGTAISAAVGRVPDPSTYGISTPWGSSELTRIVANDVFGTDRPVNDRASAMRIPAIARGRNLFCSTAAGLPLEQLIGADVDAVQPTWLQRAGNGQSPQLRMVWTIDDLIFYGWSCWWRDNAADGTIAEAHRLEQSEWEIDDDLQVLVDGKPVNKGKSPDVIVIPGLHEGLLQFGRDVLDDTRVLYRNVRARILNPSPHLNLHQTDGEDLTDEEIDKLVDRWAAARQGKNGGVGYTSKLIELEELGGSSDAQLMIEARNAAAVDCARMLGMHAGMVDATTPKSSLNYETTTGRNQEFVDFDMALYLTPITARLSLDDTTAPGKRVAFDLSSFTSKVAPMTGPVTED